MVPDKKYGFKRFLYSIKYSMQGIKHNYTKEQSLMIHLGITILVITLGFVFKIEIWEWIVSLIFLGIVISLELLNTAMEAAIDLATKEYSELARIAKDCGSAAVFIMSFTGLIVGLLIYVPKIIELFNGAGL